MLVFAVVAALVACAVAGAANVAVQTEWAARELMRELDVEAVGTHIDPAHCGVVLAQADNAALPAALAALGLAPVGALGPQAFSIRCATVNCTLCFVVGGDGAGVQYGALHLIDASRVAAAESRATRTPLLAEPVAIDKSPFIAWRGWYCSLHATAFHPDFFLIVVVGLQA